METITSFDDWVRHQRKALDMTQAQLAARVGCAVVTIKKIEQATRRPSHEMAKVLAEALAIPEAQREAFLRLARHEYVEPDVFPTIAVAASPFSTSALPAPYDNAIAENNFVGRERELAQLDTHLTGALNGSSRIVFVTGEAGYGKTTLLAEFARRALSTYPDLIATGGNCDAYAGVGNPYLPFRDVMAALTCDTEAPEPIHLLSKDQRRRLWTLLPYSSRALIDHGPELIDVFVSGMRLHQRVTEHPIAGDTCGAELSVLMQRHTPREEVPQRRLFEQYAQVLRALAHRQPLLILLDDLQWIDHASASLLFYLTRRLTGARILFIGTYRRSEVESAMATDQDASEPPDAHPVITLLQELKRRYGDIEIDLGQTTSETDKAFVNALIDSEPNLLTEGFRTALFNRTWGHPLFTVELLHDLQERGDLVQDEQGRWVEGNVVDWQGLPARVEAVISRRIGRTPAKLQEALKIASVEGETFTAEVVAQILGIDGWEMVRQLSNIAGRQHRLVTTQGNQRLGTQLLSRYRFAHNLFQDYLYGSLDTAERAYLHEAVGNSLEQLATGQTEAVAVELGHHFRAAGLTTKAIDYLRLAGRQAVAMSAHQEAIAHLTTALHLLSELPATDERARRELQLQTDLGISYKITKGFAAPEVEMVYRRAQSLCEVVGDPKSWACALWGLHSLYSVRGDMKLAGACAQTCLALAQDHPILQLTGDFIAGCFASHTGQLRLAQQHFDRVLAAYSEDQHMDLIFLAGIDLGVFANAHLSHTLCYLGYPDQALRVSHESVAAARALNHPFTYAAALSYQAMLYQLRGDPHAVQDTTMTAHRFCREHDFPYYETWNAFLHGWASAKLSRVEQGIEQMKLSLAEIQGLRTGLRRPYYLGLLAEVCGENGQVEDALNLLTDGLDQIDRQDQSLYLPDLQRIQAELLKWTDADSEHIESCLRSAIAIARRQEAKLPELQAVAQLARLYQRQSKETQARQILEPVVGWFSEGFALDEVIKAQRLQESLT